MHGEVGAERTRGRARRRVLPDRDVPVEHASHHVALAAHREQVERLGIGRLADRVARGGVALGPPQRGLVPHGHHHVRDAGRHRDHRQVSDEITRLEPRTGGHRRAIFDRFAELGRQLQHRRPRAGEVDLHRHVTGRRRLHEGGRHASFRDEQERGADRRMAREGQLAVGGEDAHVVAVVAHRRHERRLRERDLAGEREHRVGVDAVGYVGHHAQLVAGERHVGEYVEQSEAHPHGVAVSQPGVLLGLTDVPRTLAGVAQWQSSSLPSWLCGFDSRHPLRRAEEAAPQDRPFVQEPIAQDGAGGIDGGIDVPAGAAAGPR